MTLTAQQQFILGAMCMNEQFRNQLFAAGNVAPPERRIQIAALIQAYATDKDVQIEDSVADNVENVVKSESTGRVAAQNALQSVKADVCPFWPC
jgi:hypothetical protein